MLSKKTLRKEFNMFKIGDLVERIEDDWYPISIGDRDVVTYITNNKVGLHLRGYGNKEFAVKKFKLIKRKDLSTELDYLDAFQINFKEGV